MEEGNRPELLSLLVPASACFSPRANNDDIAPHLNVNCSRLLRTPQRNSANRHCSRYSVQGDTVLVIGAGTNAGVETAISRGRKVEAFVASPEEAAEVEDNAKAAFRQAFSRGIFQVSIDILFFRSIVSAFQCKCVRWIGDSSRSS